VRLRRRPDEQHLHDERSLRKASHTLFRMPISRRSAALLGTIIASAVPASSCGTANSPPASSSTSAEAVGAGGFVGAPVPVEAPHDFTLTDSSRRPASTREYRGHVLVLAFVGTRCRAPCTIIGDQIRGAL